MLTFSCFCQVENGIIIAYLSYRCNLFVLYVFDALDESEDDFAGVIFINWWKNDD